MYSLFQQIGPEIPFTLLLLALLGFRQRVNPRTSLWINLHPAKLWTLLDVYDGKVENWGNTVIRADLIDADKKIFRKTYTTTQLNGIVRPFTALFRIHEREPELHLKLVREGLEGKSENNELLAITYDLQSEAGGTRLHTVYNWGSRPLIAQLLARADLWSGAFRLKGLAETGVPNERPYKWISAGVAVVTGLVTLGAFGMIMGLKAAMLLLLALFIHEFGHLLAFRMMGQPWGRMVFLPFLGAIAMPRLPHESQGQSVFAALMGPGFSTLLAMLCALPWLLDGQPHPIAVVLGVITAGLNVFNLLPAEPLDGGMALRSVLGRLIGARANWGLMAVGALVVLTGVAMEQIVLVIFGGLAILANLKSRKIDVGLAPLSTLQMCITAFGYMAIMAAHVTMLRFFIAQLSLLSS
jgi:Zn-dependent protease